MRVSRQFYFLIEKTSHAQKNTKRTKRKQATFTQTFFTRIKSTKRQASDFLFLRYFYAHKNAAFFVLHTKKHKKHIKSIKTQISE